MIFDEFFAWLRNNESIAIWLEGLALVLIFIWDRIDAHQQDETSLAQLRVSQDQVEALQKPCLVFSTAPRDQSIAVLDPNGSAMEIRCPEGQAEIQNIGAGPAVNARYSLTPTNPDSTAARPSGYLVGMLPAEKFLTPIPRGILVGNEWQIVVTYESLSGRKYKTACIVDDLVLTNFKFEER
jgi:hypothetical protein